MTQRGPLIVLSGYFLARVWICQLSPCHGLATAGKTPTASEAEIRTGEVGRHWGPYGESEAKPALGLSGATFALSRRGFSMNIKHSIVALGAAGATAALVFGGSAVSTAFTSQSPTQTDSCQRRQDRHHGRPRELHLCDEAALPGDAAQSAATVTITNTSDVPAMHSLTLGTPQVGRGRDRSCARPEQAGGLHRRTTTGHLGQAGGRGTTPCQRRVRSSPATSSPSRSR